MTNIGETLRAAREEQAFSLDDVVAATRIRTHFLEALEENNFDALGGNVYVRGFLRNYATFLGLDPEPLVAPFRSKEHKLPVYKPSAQPRYLAEPLQSNPLPLGRILFMLFFLILLGVIGFSLWVRPASLDSIMAYLPIQRENTASVATPIQPALIEATETAEPLATEESTQSTDVVEEEPTEPSEPAEEGEEAPEPTEAPVEEEGTSEPSATVSAEASPTEEVATAVPTATRPPRTPTAVVSDTVPTPVTLVSDTGAAPTEVVAAPTEAVAAPTEAVATPTATEVPPTEVVATPTIVVSQTPTLVPTESVPTPTPEPTATEVNQEVVIQAQIQGDTWLRVFTDNNSANAIQETVTAGDSFEWIGLESVNIRAGNGAAISITVNGQEYGVLGGSGQVVDLRWERDPEGDVPILVQQ